MGSKTSKEITNIIEITNKTPSIDIPFSYFSDKKIRDFTILSRDEIGIYWYFDKKNMYIFSINVIDDTYRKLKKRAHKSNKIIHNNLLQLSAVFVVYEDRYFDLL